MGETNLAVKQSSNFKNSILKSFKQLEAVFLTKHYFPLSDTFIPYPPQFCDIFFNTDLVVWVLPEKSSSEINDVGGSEQRNQVLKVEL